MKTKTKERFTVCYTPLDTDVLGRVWIAAHQQGVIFLDFSERESGFIEKLQSILGHFPGKPEIRLDPTNLSTVLDALLAYFNQRTPIPKDLLVEIGFLTKFQKDILGRVQAIPFGTVTTYGEIARELGNENASRAVGQVLRRNPLPIIIPCHRVVRADGSVGGYGGILGSERKIALLKHEGIILA